MTEPYDQYTADLRTLERIERETRNHPNRELFGPLLLAQLKRTRELGPQPLDRRTQPEPGQEWRQIISQLDTTILPEDAGPPDDNLFTP